MDVDIRIQYHNIIMHCYYDPQIGSANRRVAYFGSKQSSHGLFAFLIAMRAAWIFLGMALAEGGDGESGSRTVVRRSRMHAPGTADEAPADRGREPPWRRDTGARESRAAELKGSIGEGPNHSNHSNHSNSLKVGI